jgi:hypothetical protein
MGGGPSKCDAPTADNPELGDITARSSKIQKRPGFFDKLEVTCWSENPDWASAALLRGRVGDTPPPPPPPPLSAAGLKVVKDHYKIASLSLGGLLLLMIALYFFMHHSSHE